MKRISALIICLTLLILPRLSSSTVAQTESTAPYIYYYSDILNAFVIERADGTDSRTIGDDLIPEDTNTISGPGWSPSGEWFAWTSAWVTGYGQVDRGYQPVAVHVSGERYVTTLDDIQDARMAWSPTDDLLFVASYIYNSSDDTETIQTGTLRLMLIDPADDSILVSYETAKYINWNYLPTVALLNWVDANHAIAYFNDPFVTSNRGDYQTNVVIFDTDGTVVHKTYSNVLTYASPEIPAISSAGYLIEQWDENMTLIENVVTDEAVHITAPFLWDVRWHSDGETATVWGPDPNCEAVPCERITWEFSVQRGFQQIEQPPPSYSIHLIAEEKCSQTTMRYVTIPIAKLLQFGRQIVGIFDCVERKIISTYEFMAVGDIAEMSWDGQYIAYFQNGLYIINTRTDESLYLRPDGRSYDGPQSGYILWHDQQEWLIRGQCSSRAGGGCGPSYIGVASADGSVNRDLTLSYFEEPGMGWLPEQVDPSILSQGRSRSVLQEPDRIIHSTDWISALSWSPDSRQLAVLPLNYRSERTGIIYNVESAEVVATIDDVNIGEEIGWQLDDDNMYSPVIVDQSLSIRLEIDGRTLAISADEHYAVISTVADGVSVIEINSSLSIFKPADYNPFSFPNAAFSPDTSLVAISATYYQPIHIWSIPSGEIVAQINTNGTALAFSPDGHTLAVASSWDIQLWDVDRLVSGGD